jgi:hypothetical protein
VQVHQNKNIKMKRIIILTLLLAAAFYGLAQEVVSSAGETYKTASAEVSWTIGETVIETVSNGSATLTQGFHQTKLTVTAISDNDWPGLKINAFPNPVGDILNMEFSILPEEISFVVIDILGKTVQQDFIKSDKTILDFSDFAAGHYFLKIQTKAGKPVQTFKIVKK